MVGRLLWQDFTRRLAKLPRAFKAASAGVAFCWLQCLSAHAEAQLTVGWGEGTLPGWHGLFATNTGDGPIVIKSIELNDRPDCRLVYFDLAKSDLPDPRALARINFGWVTVVTTMRMFNLPIFFSQKKLAELPGAASSDPVLQVGESVGIGKHADCPTVVRATFDTDSGPIQIEFDPPFTPR